MAADMDIDFTRRNKKPRPLTEGEKDKLDEFVDAIHYSARCVVYFQGPRRVNADHLVDTRTSNTNTATSSFPSRCSR